MKCKSSTSVSPLVIRQVPANKTLEQSIQWHDDRQMDYSIEDAFPFNETNARTVTTRTNDEYRFASIVQRRLMPRTSGERARSSGEINRAVLLIIDRPRVKISKQDQHSRLIQEEERTN